jgi:hypothetical protein
LIGSHVMASNNGVWVPVLLDTEDIQALGRRKLSIGSHGYAQMWEQKTVIVVHRWVLGLCKGDRRIGDHINGNRLDNRRSNLRIVDASGSSQNVSGRGRSRFRGVYPTRQGRWQAKVKFKGKYYCLGSFDTEEEAAAVADAKRRELMPFYVSR